MSFPTNLLSKFKDATSTTAKAKDKSDNVEGEWDVVSAEEATGYYPDRITLFLGPYLETRHHILLIDIPQTSKKLNYIATLEPAHRYMHLTTLEAHMVTSYEALVGASVNALVGVASWTDIITLAITAEVLHDSMVEGKAITALKLKADKKSTPSFTHQDLAFARNCQLKTGAGERLMQTLEELASPGAVKSPAGKAAKYGKSVLRGKSLAGVKKVGEGDGKEYPSRQPSIPPSVEALRSGTVGGFAWLE